MKVIGWISYNDIEDYMEDDCIGGFGGFFKDGMRWKDYIYIYNNKGKEYAEALREAILERELKCSGEQHQYGEGYIPVFSDGTIASFTYRSWGDLMAAVWSEEENKDYNYMHFYM